MSLPVITVEQMRRWEAATWETGKTEAEVIAQVGEIVVKRALELTQPGDAILLLAGKGHNGDDVRAMANHLQERDVSLLSITDPAKTLSNLATALEPRPALVVDGLFGIGLNRVLDADWMQIISQLNANRLRVLSVDVPSGVDAATGEIQGAAIRAEEGDRMGQFLHAHDLAEAVVRVGGEPVDGPVNVAPDGWIPAPLMAELGGPAPRLRLPGPLAGLAADVRWRLGLTDAPPTVVPYTVYPWVIANDRLRAMGWTPAHSNEEAYVAGYEPRATDRLNAKRRQQLSLAAAGGAVALVVTGLGWMVRSFRRR